MRLAARLGVIALVGTALGCAPATTSGPTVAATSDPQPSQEEPLESAVLLPPAPRPEGLFATLQIPPMSVLEGQLTSLPGSQLVQLSGLGPHLLQELYDLLERDAGIDCAASVSWCKKHQIPELYAACAFPIADYGRALQQLGQKHEAERIESRVHRFFLPLSPDQAPYERPCPTEAGPNPGDEPATCIPVGYAACDLSQALGHAPARLTCTEYNRSLEKLRPWLSRGKPAERAGGDTTRLDVDCAELRRQALSYLTREGRKAVEAVEQILTRELQVADPATLAIPGQLLEQSLQLFGECQGLTAEATIRADGAAVTAELELNAAESWPARVLATQLAKAQPAPDAFWKLPGDATEAGFGLGIDPALTEPLLQGAARLVRAVTQAAPASPALRRAANEYVAAIPSVQGPVVWATGPDAGAQLADDATVSQFTRLVLAYEAAFGWSLWGVAAPKASFERWLRSGERLYSALLREVFSSFGPFGMPTAFAPTIRYRKRVPGLPPGSVAFDVEFPTEQEVQKALSGGIAAPPVPQRSQPRRRSVLRVAAVPDGPGQTWIALSFNHALLRDKVAVVLDRKDRSKTLADRGELAALRDGNHVLGGYTCVSAQTQPSFGGLLAFEYPYRMQAWHQLVSAARRGASTPIVYRVGGSAGSGLKLRFETEIVPDAWQEAMVVLDELATQSQPVPVYGPGVPALPVP